METPASHITATFQCYCGATQDETLDTIHEHDDFPICDECDTFMYMTNTLTVKP